MDFKKDYYKVLEINNAASKEEIRASYRKLVRKYHPDKNPNNPECEEIIKEINEAYSILQDDDLRIIYDNYINDKILQNQDIKEENKRTFTVKKTIRKDLKFYLKGLIVIKYTGDQDVKLSKNNISETFYNLHTTDVEIIIDQKNIVSRDLFNSKIESDDENFSPFINDAIRTIIIAEDGTKEFFELKIHDLKIKNITIVDVIKQDGITCGTIKGNFTGNIIKEEYEETEEVVTECYGETGNVETNYDDEGIATSSRKEYYYSNGTTYWGPWINIKRPFKNRNSRGPNKPYSNGCLKTFGFEHNSGCYNTSGCLGSFFSIFYWVWILGIFLKFSPIIGIILLVIFLLSFFGGRRISNISNIISPFLRYLFYTIITLFIIGIFINLFTNSSKFIRREDNGDKSSTITETKTSYSDKNNKNDYLISHNIKWKSLNDDTFNITLSILLSDLKKSEVKHSSMGIELRNESDFSYIYNELYTYDSSKFDRVYKAYDSIIIENKLDKKNAAEMIVSSIQAVPYSSVLESSCESENKSIRYSFYNNTNNCVGFEKYGVRSPIEFLKDLKGDCDTRALFLYTVLKRFNYDVVILTSSEYKHALIAINLNEQNPIEGKNILINNKKYFLWETTSYGWKPGIISNEISNLKNWNLAFIN